MAKNYQGIKTFESQLKFKKVEAKSGFGDGVGKFTIQAYLESGNVCTSEQSYLPHGLLTSKQVELLGKIGIHIGQNHVGNLYVNEWIFPYKKEVSVEAQAEFWRPEAEAVLEKIVAASKEQLVVIEIKDDKVERENEELKKKIEACMGGREEQGKNRKQSKKSGINKITRKWSDKLTEEELSKGIDTVKWF